MMRSILIASLACIQLAANAQERQPTDIELKATYCLAVTQGMVTLARRVQAELTPNDSAYEAATNHVVTTEDNLRRLQSYVVPKVGELDITAMILARKRGQTDFGSLESVSMACVTRCTPQQANRSRFDACFAKCRADTPVFARLDGCRDLSWLPF